MVRTRFAPSPTGYLHIGGLRTALYAWLYARKNNGKFILRIEDTDQNRLVDGACDVIYRTLRETGLFYDEGPDVAGECGPYIQSDRQSIYRDYAEQLVKSGHAYYCFCTKETLTEQRAEQGFKYDKRCLLIPLEEAQKRIQNGEEYVIRQNVPTEGVSEYNDAVFGGISVPMSDMEDNILLKSDGWPTYNLANVVDDHLMGITHVIRGAEYLSSTPKYNLLYDAFGWERPIYIHLPPVMRDKQHKLSKRYGDASYEDFISKGYLKEAILNYIALLGWSPAGEREIYSLEELAEVFDIEGVSKAPAIFDNEKLTWMNGEYIRSLTEEEFLVRAKPYLDKSLSHDFDSHIICEIIRPRLETLTQIGEKLSFLNDMPKYDLELYTNKKMKTTKQSSAQTLEELFPILKNWDDFSIEGLKGIISRFVEEHGVKNGTVLWPLRIAISGTLVTPGGAYEIAALLGKDETIKRLSYSLSRLQG